MIKISGLFIYLFVFTNAWSLVRTKTDAGLNVSWKNTNKIDLDVVINSSGLSSADVKVIIGNSINEWNNESSVSISPSYVTSSNSVNRIEFSAGYSPYLGSGVVAVTTINFSNLNGKIKSAVVYINEQSYNFTNDPTDNPQLAPYDIYLGDAITHELGHLYGLGHSEVIGSTMNYSAFLGQYDLHEEDKSAIRSIYPAATTGNINGRVIGGSAIPVFGAYVSAISAKSGEIVGSAISNSDGSFSISGLAQEDDNYYIYVEPLKNKNALPAYYSSAQSNFCPENYTGSFYTSCGNSNKGRPQRIGFTDSDTSIDIGDITIRCDLGVNTNYLSTKSQGSDTNFEIISSGSDLVADGGQSFIGFFYKTQVSNSDKNSSDWDILDIDLSGVDTPAGKSIQVTVLGLGLGVPVKYYVTLMNSSSVTLLTDDVDGEVVQRYPMDSDQFFKLKIKPQSITSSSALKQVLPQPSVFADDRYFYLVMVDVLDQVYPYPMLSVGQSVIDDNYACTEAPFTFAVAAVTKELINDEDISLLSASCGTISGPNDSGNSGGGPLSLCLGFILTFFISRLRRPNKIV